MNTSTIAQTLPCRTECDLAVWARRIGIAMFAMTLAALESWLRFPIRPLFDGYLQSSMSRIWSVAASVFYHRSF
jgi:hypothetical protein